MLLDKCLTERYGGRLYKKDNVLLHTHLKNAIIFNLADGCKYVTYIMCPKRKRLGNSVYDIMTNRDAAEMLDHMMSYTETPMFVNTTLGVALAIPSITPSSSFGVLLFPDIGADNALRIAMRSGYDVRFGASLTEEKHWRISPTCIERQQSCEELFSLIENAFFRTAKDNLLDGNITHMLEQKIYALSYLTSCPAELICIEPTTAVGSFDMGLFTAFVLTMFLIARRVCPHHQVMVILDNTPHGTAVRTSMVTTGISFVNMPAIEYWKELTARKHMDFDVQRTAQVLHTKLIPVCFDFSVLGLKSDNDADIEKN